jgi:cyclopropane-fatty-acyl-phospholipid synthase
VSLAGAAVRLAERAPAPDGLRRLGVGALVCGAGRRLAKGGLADAAFAEAMARRAVAEETAEANRQHYELPPAFFAEFLGPHRKYSSCLYEPGDTLAQAEARALAETAVHADLADGQEILELGCGWGSLSLWMAQHYPRARVTAVSNSASQVAFINEEARRRGFGRLEAVKADMNVFAPERRYDRIVSVEMFEHMSNWRVLLQRARGWLGPEGRLFLHVFAHASHAYAFNSADEADWIAQHFFAGGVMPSHGLVRQYADLFEVEAEWRWSGEHYRRTADHWLENFDRNRRRIAPVLQQVYGADWRVWRRRWRLFFLATSGLFGADRGLSWGVSHYRLRPTN